MSKKRNRIFINNLSKIIAIISFVIFFIFSYYIFKLNMLPSKYVLIFFFSFILLYSFFTLLSFINKVKKKIKIINMVILTLFSIVFGFGIFYIDKTINFVDKISEETSQNKEYYISVLINSSIKEIKDLKNKKIGLYNSGSQKNSLKATEKLTKTISFQTTKYEDVIEMFESLNNNEIDAVLIDNTIINLLESELNYLNVSLKKIFTFSINIETEDIVKVVDVTTTPFNIYVSGGDAYGSIDRVTNTDVNIVVSVNPKTQQILITSIPRDYYVNLIGLEDTNAMDKLTHAGYYGIETSVKTVEKLLDTEINYYVKINFSTIENLVNAIGGINVYSDFAFTASDHIHTYNYGNNYLDGAAALMFARERKSFSNGDIQRVKNQQKVIKEIINKITSSTVLISKYTTLLDSMSNYFQTNLDSKSVSRLVKFQLNKMYSWQISNQTLIGTDLYTYTYSFPSMELYVMKPNNEVVEEAQHKIKEFLAN